MSGDDEWTHVGKGLHDRCLACAQRWKRDMNGPDFMTLNEVAAAWAADIEVPQARVDAAKAILARFKL